MSGFDHASSFGRNAADYARHRPTYPAAIFDRIAALAPSRGVAVDLATGSGQAALALAERFVRVYALDHSPELIAGVPAHPRVTTMVQDAQSFVLPEPADVVAIFQALHWFATDALWARVRAALRPGGLLAVVGYSWFSVDPAVDAVVTERVLPPIDPYWSPKNRMLLDGYAGLVFPFPEIAPGPGLPPIELTWTRTQLLAYVGTWSAVARLREEGRDVLAEIAPILAEVWPADEPRAVTIPLAVRLFRP